VRGSRDSVGDAINFLNYIENFIILNIQDMMGDTVMVKIIGSVCLSIALWLENLTVGVIIDTSNIVFVFGKKTTT
jgi:hypothetical protein